MACLGGVWVEGDGLVLRIEEIGCWLESEVEEVGFRVSEGVLD